MRINFTKKRSGFLLVEALISIGILIMVASTGITLLVLAQRAINFNANSLEASWLAQEGVNSLRGLRDSNWIRYGYDKENCWDIAVDPCNGANKIQTGTYRLETSLTDPPVLTSTTQAVDLLDGVDTEDEEYLLYYQDLDPATDFDGDGETDNDLQFVGHGGGVKESKFYREFDITTLSPDELEAIVNVHWLEGSDPKKISLPVTLTNYLLEE